MLCTDACGQGLGGVLMQDNHVVCYESRKLKDREKNYATHDLELASMYMLSRCGGITYWEESLS